MNHGYDHAHQFGGLGPGQINAVSGAVAGLVAGVAVCPLDVVKTMQQVRGFRDSRYRNIVTSWHTIIHEDGYKGLYRGLTPLVLGYLPTWAIYFFMYGTLREILPDGLMANVVAAVGSGATSTVITNPIWVIKTRLMSQSKASSWHYTGIIDAARTMYREEGIRVFYSGLTSAFLGLPHVAIQFPLYEYLKRRFNAEKHGLHAYLLCSVLSKIVASTITYPHEVVRSRDQIKSSNKYRGVLKTSMVLFREEGWRVFYSGLGTNICRAVPSSAITLATYETVSHYLRRNYSSDRLWKKEL